jgi:hypothetical protein
MSYKSQLFPLSSACQAALHRQVGLSWGSSPASLRNADLQEMKFLRGWLIYDSELQPTLERGRVNWNLVAGLTLAIGVSAGFWAGMALVISWASR